MSLGKILVVDDDKDVVRLMRGYLEQAGYHVLVAYNGETALHMLQRERPDLLLLDLMLPDRDGWDITRAIRNDPLVSGIPIIMLTARVADEEKIVGLEIGADDYVTKPYNPREVVARVQALMRRSHQDYQKRSEHIILRVGNLQMDIHGRQLLVAGQVVDLTATEFDLLRALMEDAGYVLTRGELIRKALGSDYMGIERTLDSHIRNLRLKIEADPKKPQYIKTIYGVGYKLTAGEDV
jgi:two-component system alkaline phosphatase synthesis response regulator PhoP